MATIKRPPAPKKKVVVPETKPETKPETELPQDVLAELAQSVESAEDKLAKAMAGIDLDVPDTLQVPETKPETKSETEADYIAPPPPTPAEFTNQPVVYTRPAQMTSAYAKYCATVGQSKK